MRLGEGVYWVGSAEPAYQLHCNPYLLVESGEGVLIDPGSPSDFSEVYRKVSSLIPVSKLRWIVLLHQDPDVASSTPLFEERGFAGQVATHWRTSLIAAYYDISSPFYLLNEHDLELTFGSGRTLRFIPAPYLHFPGALMAYDGKTGILFSGDLFGAISRDWGLFAGEDYEQGMIPFHQHYMPSNDILRPVMELLLQRQVTMICPQHGSIIRDHVKRYIVLLRDLECGQLLHPVRENLIAQGGYHYLIEQVIERLSASFSLKEVLACFRNTPVILNPENGKPERFEGPAEEMWDRFFELIYAYGGSRWLALVEPLMQRFEGQYGITRPGIFLGELAKAKRKSLGLQEMKEHLEKVNASLRSNLELTYEEMTKDPVTGLYNEDFLVRYVLNLLNEAQWNNFVTFFIQIDDMKQLNDSIGEQAGDEVISGVGSLLFEEKEEDDYLFRISGPVFVLVCADTDHDEASKRAERIRNAVEDSRRFLEKVTVTVAVLPVAHDRVRNMPATEAMNYLISRGKGILRDSLREGGNRVIFDTGEERRSSIEGRVLIAEYDRFHADLIQDALKRLTIDVRICMNGPEVASVVRDYHPDVIISELFLPETDAFSVKEELQEHTRTKEIPFIIISHQKNESTVVRAHNLGIMHYLKKPYMLSELLGIVNTYVERALQHGT